MLRKVIGETTEGDKLDLYIRVALAMNILYRRIVIEESVCGWLTRESGRRKCVAPITIT